MNGECFLCGQWGQLERHHIFGGANRKMSEKYGLIANLCHACHNEPPGGAHHCADTRGELQRMGQKKAMEENHWGVEDFRAVFGKNYL